MRRRHRVDGQEIERRRTVHQDIGEVCLIRIAGVSNGASALRSRKARSRAWPISSSSPERSSVDGARCRRGTAVATIASRNAARQSEHRRSSSGGLRRSMPRPVEALPCGSRSTISTSSPIAASAVPRLIAVVVLPTPPFWLATARIRGRLAACGRGLRGRRRKGQLLQRIGPKMMDRSSRPMFLSLAVHFVPRTVSVPGRARRRFGPLIGQTLR